LSTKGRSYRPEIADRRDFPIAHRRASASRDCARWHKKTQRTKAPLHTAIRPMQCPSWGQTEKNSLRANVFRVTPESGPCSIQQACLKGADSVEKVFLGCRPKLFRTADAFRTRQYDGPHRFTQKRPRSFAWALRSIAVVEPAKNQLLRDFRRRSIFDFCNTICQHRTRAPQQMAAYEVVILSLLA
jgi:hypothetical protein